MIKQYLNNNLYTLGITEVQCGIVTGIITETTIAAQEEITFNYTFEKPFSQVPVVVATPFSIGSSFTFRIGTVTVNGFSGSVRNIRTVSFNPSSFSFRYIAML